MKQRAWRGEIGKERVVVGVIWSEKLVINIEHKKPKAIKKQRRERMMLN